MVQKLHYHFLRSQSPNPGKYTVALNHVTLFPIGDSDPCCSFSFVCSVSFFDNFTLRFMVAVVFFEFSCLGV